MLPQGGRGSNTNDRFTDSNRNRGYPWYRSLRSDHFKWGER